MRKVSTQAGEIATTLTILGLGLVIVGVIGAAVLSQIETKPLPRAQASCPVGEVTDARFCREAGCQAIVKESRVSSLCCRVVNGARENTTTPVPESELNCYNNTCTRQILPGQSFPYCSDARGADPQCCTRQYQSGANSYCEHPCNPTRCTQTVETIYTCLPFPTVTVGPSPTSYHAPTPRRRPTNPWVTPRISPTVSVTPSVTPTNTPTPTATLTPTPTSTNTPTPTPTPTNTPTPTLTPTPTPLACPFPRADAPANHPPNCPAGAEMVNRLPVVPANVSYPQESLAPCDISSEMNRNFNFVVDSNFGVTFPWCPPKKLTRLREYRWTVYMSPPEGGSDINCFETDHGFGVIAGAEAKGVFQLLPNKCRRVNARFRGSVRAIFAEATIRSEDSKFFDCCRTDEVKTNYVNGPIPAPSPTITPTPTPTIYLPPLPPSPQAPPGTPGTYLCTTSVVNFREVNSCQVRQTLAADTQVRVEAGPYIFDQCRWFDEVPRYAVTYADNTRGLIAAEYLRSCSSNPHPPPPPRAEDICGPAPRNCACAANSSPCGWRNLLRYFDGDEQKAKYASAICNIESSGVANALNNGCRQPLGTSHNTCDYSVGLFQVNCLAKLGQSVVPYSCPCVERRARGESCPEELEHMNSCNINSQNAERVAQCVSDWSDAEGNIAEMLRLSNNGTNWSGGHWSGARYCGIY